MADLETEHERGLRLIEESEVGLHTLPISAPSASMDQENSDVLGMYETKVHGQWGTAWRRFIRSPRAMIGLFVFLSITLFSLVYTLLHPIPPGNGITGNLLQYPTWAHPFGTNIEGQDNFTQVMQGIFQDVEIAFVVAGISVGIGIVIGATAGFYGGWIDNLLMRLVDFILVIPLLVILILLSNNIAGSAANWLLLAGIIGMFAWTYMARLIRADFQSLREREFVEASRALGATDFRLIWKHLLPNAIGPIVVNATLLIAGAIGIEASLSFIGFGIKPPAVSLGLLIQQNEGLADPYWFLFIYPCLFLLVLILCVFFIGDGLQNALDPRKNRVRS